MDAVTAYLYGSLDLDIYMKVPEGLDIPNKNHSQHVLCKASKVIIRFEAVGKNVVQPTKGIPSTERFFQ
jgi:predicted Zn-dependent protease